MKRFIENDCYRFIFENSLDAMMLTGIEGHIYHANPAACKIFQMTEEEICRAGRAGLVDMSDPGLAAALAEREKTGQARAELTFIRKDGSKFSADCASAVFKDAEGGTWTVMIIRDLTMFKQTESAMRRNQEEANHFATYDYLTEALNRRGFVDRLEQEMARCIREKLPMCLILADIDYFKQINDNFGHLNGDVVLKYFSQCISKHLRPYDFLGRYGGDEFIICLPETHLDEAEIIAERLRSQIEQMQIHHESLLIRITASFGVAYYDYTSPESLDTLISKVDNNMYSAKTKRNTVFALGK